MKILILVLFSIMENHEKFIIIIGSIFNHIEVLDLNICISNHLVESNIDCTYTHV